MEIVHNQNLLKYWSLPEIIPHEIIFIWMNAGLKLSVKKKIINLQLRRYVSLSDYVILGLEITFCLFILYYIMEETLELRLGFHTTNIFI